MLRDHQPIVISEFNGLWKRGDYENTPLDHFERCNNVQFVGSSGVASRFGIGPSQDVAGPILDILRIYNYPTTSGNTTILLARNGSDGEIYHVVDSTTVFGPILTVAGMTDFAFIPYAGRAYISPFSSFAQGDLFIEKGLENEFVYVYAGDGTAARKAAGPPLSGSLTIANGAAGNTDPGFHLFAFVYETVSGYLAAPGAITGFTSAANFSVSFGNVPTSGDPNVTRRHLVATKVIPSYDGNTTGYTFYFVPNATINNDTDTFLNNISFFDADLLNDASRLLDNFEEIPAGAWMTLYHGRLIVGTTFDQISIAYVSLAGEPEAINQIDGIIAMTPDGNPMTNGQELRDVLYTFKRSKTSSFIDNGDTPSTWPQVLIDNALGTSVHGIATVLDSGSSNVDYLMICTYQGLNLFNGRYITPELSWKIEELWRLLERREFRKLQIVNEPISKSLYITLPDKTVLYANYSNGMDPKKIRWSPWSWIMGVNTVAIVNIDEIIFGSDIN